jgi:hypothetical protein
MSAHKLVTPDEWDHLVVVLGRRHFGKTSQALDVVLDLSETPAYVVAHDPGLRIKAWTPRRGKLPEGTIVRHETVEAARAALAKNPRGVHCISTPDAEPVMELARDIGRASKTAHGGRAGVPVVCWVNEATSAASASPQRFDGMITYLSTQGRHDLVALVIECQTSRLINHTVLSNYTEAFLFRTSDEVAVKRMRSFGVPEATLRQLPSLPKYKYIRVDPSAE